MSAHIEYVPLRHNAASVERKDLLNINYYEHAHTIYDPIRHVTSWRRRVTDRLLIGAKWTDDGNHQPLDIKHRTMKLLCFALCAIKHF